MYERDVDGREKDLLVDMGQQCECFWRIRRFFFFECSSQPKLYLLVHPPRNGCVWSLPSPNSILRGSISTYALYI